MTDDSNRHTKASDVRAFGCVILEVSTGSHSLIVGGLNHSLGTDFHWTNPVPRYPKYSRRDCRHLQRAVTLD